MRIAFTANDGGNDIDRYGIACGVSSASGEYVLFQRDAENAKEGFGIHFEYKDQLFSGYECVAACRFSSNMMSVDLAKPLDKRHHAIKDVTGFDIALQLSPGKWNEIRDGLKQVFRDEDDKLAITEPT